MPSGGDDAEAAQGTEGRPEAALLPPVYFKGASSRAELIRDIQDENTSAHTFLFDKKFERSREMLVFLEETKIWQEALLDCMRRAGVNAPKACTALDGIVKERVAYSRANYNHTLRPTLSPGLPDVYERYPPRDAPPAAGTL